MSSPIPEYSFETPRHQRLSLPYPIVLHLLDTPSPFQLLKLQKTCKYFFAKKKIVVSETPVECQREGSSGFVDANKKQLLLGSNKFWFTELMSHHHGPAHWVTPCTLPHPNIYRLTLSKLSIGHQELSLNAINVLLSNQKMKKLELNRVIILDSEGNSVPDDYILGKVPNLKEFHYFNLREVYSNQSLERLNSLKPFIKLKHFTFSTLPGKLILKFWQRLLKIIWSQQAMWNCVVNVWFCKV